MSGCDQTNANSLRGYKTRSRHVEYETFESSLVSVSANHCMRNQQGKYRRRKKDALGRAGGGEAAFRKRETPPGAGEFWAVNAGE